MPPYFETFEPPFFLQPDERFAELGFTGEVFDFSASITDDALEKRIQDRFEAFYRIDLSGVRATVTNREVTLDGIVEDERVRKLAETTCDNTPHVRAVKNLLKIKSVDGRPGAQKADEF
jgi:osmotically-inducible protein OsmY